MLNLAKGGKRKKKKNMAVSIDNGMVYSENNHIYGNHFIDNYEDNWRKAQAYDEGHDNLWYNQQTNTGNYWSDCSEKEYIIDGYADATDPYPIEETEQVTGEGLVFLIIPFLILAIIRRKRLKRKK